MDLPSREATVIYNPTAGFWDWRSVVSRVARFWASQGWDVHLTPTSETGHATDLARAAAEAGHGLVLAAGGDGTLNEVANGLVHTETVLGLLPVGTANSFARELGLALPNLLQPDFLLHVSRALARGRVQAMDVGRCADGRHWLLWASAGIDGFWVRQIEPRPPWFKRLGPAGYAAKALFVLPQFRGVVAEVAVDGQPLDLEGEHLMLNVSNCRRFAGGEVRLNLHAVLDDGLFEVWLFRGREWPEVLGHMLDLTRENHPRNPNVTYLRGREISVATKPAIDFHMDGEPAGMTPFSTTLVPHGLRLLVPDTAPPDLFSRPGVALAS
jgi:YegS/Rv2252/BmrU family lipid kinase